MKEASRETTNVIENTQGTLDELGGIRERLLRRHRRVGRCQAGGGLRRAGGADAAAPAADGRRPVRRALDDAVCDALGLDGERVAAIRRNLTAEPSVTGKRYAGLRPA